MKKNLAQIIFLILPVIVHSCQKELEDEPEEVSQNHYQATSQKFFENDPEALVGEWENISTITWTPDDEFTIDSTKYGLTISPTRWIRDSHSVPYTLSYQIICQYLIVDLTLHYDDGDVNAHFHEFGWDDHMRFKTYEYPNDPDIFRIDRTYVPVGYVD